MQQRIQQDLDELEKAGVISQEVSVAIRAYYAARPHPPASNRLLMAFGILGALLVGSGIMLILAHNWDDMPRTFRTLLAFLPLLAGQGVCVFAMLRKPDTRVWHEAGAVLTFIAVATAIALIHQIYNLPDHHITRFLVAWAVLGVPLMFLMRSVASSFLYLGVVTWFATETLEKGWGYSEALSAWWFFALMLPSIGFFVWMRFVQPGSNALAIHQWFIPFALFMGSIGHAVEAEEAGFLLMIALAGATYAVGATPVISTTRSFANGFRILAASGMLLSLYIMSFSFFWEEWPEEMSASTFFMEFPTILALSYSLIWVSGTVFAIRTDRKLISDPFLWLPLPIALLLFVGFQQETLAWIGMNALLLVTAVVTIWNGARKDHLGIMNIGLLTLATQIMCRFFDAEISFALRGVIFMALGAAFFGVNWFMVHKRKQVRQQEGDL